VQRGLVGTQVYGDLFGRQTLPKVDDVAHIGHRDHFAGTAGLADTGNQGVERIVHLVDPSLLVAFLRRLGVDFGDDAHHARDIARLGLCPGHAAQPRGDEKHTPGIVAAAGETLARGVHHRDGGAVDDPLRTDIHIGAGRHLAVLRHPEGVHALPVVGLRIVGDHHAVGHHDARGIGMRREQPQRVPRVHHQRLAVGHLRQVLHRQAVLRPVLEHGAVAAVGDQLVGMLRHGLVQVVLDHQHHSRGLAAAAGIFVDRPRIHLVVGTQAVHVDAPVFAQLLGKLPGQRGVVLRGEITQCVPDRQHLLLGRKYPLALGRVVDLFVIGFSGGQPIGNARADVILELLQCHIAQILLDEGYISGFQVEEDGKQGVIHITLKYGHNKSQVISGIRRVSKPGLRIYTNVEDMPKVMKGLGIAILSTSKGIMTDKQARKANVGGEVLAFVW